MMESLVFYLAACLGYLNAVCWVRFGLFIAFYTGNLVVAIFALFEQAWQEAGFRVAVLLSHTYIGVKFSQYIENRVPSSWWHLQCLWILLTACVLFVEFAWPSSRDPSEHQHQLGGFHSYYVLSPMEMLKISSFAAGMGAMGHYACTRLPVPTQVMTITMIKLSEAAILWPWSRKRNVNSIGGDDPEKLRHYSLGGCITGVMTAAVLMVSLPTRSYTLLPVLILWPLMIHAQARSKKNRIDSCCEEPNSEIYEITGDDDKGLDDDEEGLGVIIP